MDERGAGRGAEAHLPTLAVDNAISMILRGGRESGSDTFFFISLLTHYTGGTEAVRRPPWWRPNRPRPAWDHTVVSPSPGPGHVHYKSVVSKCTVSPLQADLTQCQEAPGPVDTV